MKNLKINPDDMTCHLPIQDMIELLQYKLDSLIIAKQLDSSWNYPIEELEEQINTLKAIS